MPKFLSNVEHDADIIDINGNSGTSGQVLSSLGPGNGVDWIDQSGGTSGVLSINVKNISGGTLTAGTAVSVATPSQNPPQGIVVEVIAADYDNANDMPAIGILKEDLNDDAEGEAVMMGSVSSINTNSFNVSDELYVGANGALVNSKPTTAGQLIQKIAVVVKKHSSNGVIKVLGAGRSNDVPLPLYIDNTNQRVGISEPNPAEKLVVSEARSGTGASAQTKYTLVSKSTISSGTPGTGGIKVVYDDGSNEHGFGLVSGSSSADFLTTGPMHFYTNSDLNTHSATGLAMVIRSNGNVGINETNPTSKLHSSTSASGPTDYRNRAAILGINSSTDTVHANSIGVAGKISTSGGYAIYGDADGAGGWAGYFNGKGYFSGNVGIGTSSPSSKLEIVDDLSAASTVEYPLTLSVKDDNNSIDQLGGEGVGIKFKIAGNDATDPGNTFVGASIAAVREVSTDTNSSTGLAFSVSQGDETLDEVVRIDHDGNVGIFETNPQHPLHITKNSLGLNEANSQLKIAYSGTYNLAISHRGYFFGTANNDYRFYRGSDLQMIISGYSGNSNYGYVGIGITTPSQKLHVNNGFLKVQPPEISGTTPPSITIRSLINQYQSGMESSGHLTMKSGATSNFYWYKGSTSIMYYTDALYVNKLVDKDSTGYYLDPGDTTTSLKVAGNIEHSGLTMTSGTDIDQLKTVNMTFQLTADIWTDTGINYNDLSTGTYAVQVYVDDHNVNGSHYDEYYSGMMSWIGNSTTNSTAVDEIPLHRAGHAANTGDIQLRTQRHAVSAGVHLMLQIKHSRTYTAALNNTDGRRMTFKFRRLI